MRTIFVNTDNLVGFNLILVTLLFELNLKSNPYHARNPTIWQPAVSLKRSLKIVRCSEIMSFPKTLTFHRGNYRLPSATGLIFSPLHRFLRPVIPNPLCLQTTANDGKELDSIRWHHVQSRMRMIGPRAWLVGVCLAVGRYKPNLPVIWWSHTPLKVSLCLPLPALSSLVCPLPAMVSDTGTSCPTR